MPQAEKFLFFWGKDSTYSNWHPAKFVINGVPYQNTEQYMMAAKARIFKDAIAEAAILKEADPRQVKAMGRKVKDYDEFLWVKHREKVMFDGGLAKFTQTPAFAQALLSTGALHLVEASPMDCIWGIGLSAEDPRARVPAQWRGLNLLGNALMRVRTELQIRHPGGYVPTQASLL